MKNPEIAEIFYEMADILEINNVEWKPRAYRKAARAIESLTEDVEEIQKRGGIKALEEIPGVGEKIAKKIMEFIGTGKVKEHERLLRTIPKGLSQLMEVMGIGPKKAKALYSKLGIKNIKDLEKAIKSHKVERLSGFGGKSEENIQKGIELYKKRSGRMLLGIALYEVESIVSRLKSLKEVRQIEVAGSFRRRKETIGDADMLVTSQAAQKVMDFFVAMPEVGRVIAKGPTKSEVLLKDGLQVDLRVVPPESFGSALQYFTGNKDHNIRLRQIAIKKGYKLSEYGLFQKSTNRQIAGKSEGGVYKKLGLMFIPPELRENTGEVEAAEAGKLPSLIALKDIKGDLHVHTKWSDGNNTIEDMALAARQMGYEYICISDHSKSTAIAHGLSEGDVAEQLKEIKKAKMRVKGINILAGAEVDILYDGSLDFGNDTLRKLDLVSVSVHSRFNMGSKEMTNRIINALENKYVKILNHPTGRLINKRNPIEFDFGQVLSAAKEKRKLLEINSMPDRLDLSDSYIKKAVEGGIKLVINTDAHSVDQLQYMQLGVWQARRGWATNKDIINCLDFKSLQKALKLNSE